MRFLSLKILVATSFLIAAALSPTPAVGESLLEDISENTIWTLSQSPYILTRPVEVSETATLTIEAGVKIVSNDPVSNYLSVYGGTLVIQGTSDNPVIFDGADIMVYGSGTADIQNVIMENNHAAILAFGRSAVTARGLHVIGSNGLDSIAIFDDSTLLLSDSVLEKKGVAGSALIVAQGATSTLQNVSIDGPGSGIGVFNHGTIDAEGISIMNGDVGIFAFKDSVPRNPENTELPYEKNTIKLRRTEIFSNGVGLLIRGGNEVLGYLEDSTLLDVADSSIRDNEQGVFYDGSTQINFSHIWWGDLLGPFNEAQNPLGPGNEVSNNIIFSPWLESDPFTENPENEEEPETEPGFSRDPVLLIPGITGTRLIKNYGDYEEIWPNIRTLINSFSDDFLNDLSLNTNGTQNSSLPITVGDIVRKVEIQIGPIHRTNHIFDGLIEKLETSGYREGIDLFVFPYDWRANNTETSGLLKERIEIILAETGGNKVDLITHSMGGLIARDYIASNGSSRVDDLIFLGTPHLGAPKAFKALMYGDDMGLNKIGLGLNADRMKEISQNFPSVYGLLPSKKYIDHVGIKYILDMSDSYLLGTLPRYLSHQETKQFMLGQGRNAELLARADELHEKIDDLDLSGVNTYNFAACGLTKTLGSIIVKKKKLWFPFEKVVDDYEVGYTNGDGTVPLVSAVESYGQKYYVRGYSHGGLPSAEGVPDTILAVLLGISAPLFPHIQTDIDTCDIAGTSVEKHSPIDMHIYDTEGNHTGPLENGNIEYGIDGVAYDQLGENAFAFLPDGKEYRVVNIGTDVGTYDFSVKKIAGDDSVLSENYFNKIPIEKVGSTSEVDISSLSISPVIRIDQDEDNVFEKTYTPSSELTGEESLDITWPQTVSSVSEGVVTLFATDREAGVLKIEFSLDHGKNWIIYENPFKTSFEKILFFSTDRAGNSEPVHLLNIPLNPVNANMQEHFIYGLGSYVSQLAEPGPSVAVSNISQPNILEDNQSFSSIMKEEQNGKNIKRGDFSEKPILPDSFPKNHDFRHEILAAAVRSKFKVNSGMIILGFVGLAGLVYLAKKFTKR